MKLTPEQKAFRDYGMALGELKRLREEVIYHLGYYRGLKKHEVILILRKRLYCRNALVRDAWQKRSICRMFMIPEYERICENCNHLGMGMRFYGASCNRCCRNPFTEINDEYQDKWEPRKEEQDND